MLQFPVLELGIKLLKEYEANCPETLKTVYVVNASSLFTALFAFVKPVLSKRTISKIQIHGKESRSWKRAILQDIPPHQLPTKYGGTLSSKSDFVSGSSSMDIHISYEHTQIFLELMIME
jgi:hypothetical protein